MAEETEEKKKKRRGATQRRALEQVVSDPVSRRRFVALTGASTALAALLAACGGGGSSTTGTMTTTKENAGGGSGGGETEQFGKGDVGILNYALTLEYLETAFYEEVVKSGLFKGAELDTIKKFGSEEAQHVAALSSTVKKLGGKPAPMPKTEFPLKSARSVLELAATVENLGAAAYLGQAGNIKSPEVLAAALSIHSVEGRHAAALDTLLGEPITPDGAFAAPADAKTVLKSVEPFIVG
jgi:rubrerythrin